MRSRFKESAFASSKTFKQNFPKVRCKNEIVGVFNNRTNLRRLAESVAASRNAKNISVARRDIVKSKITEFA